MPSSTWAAFFLRSRRQRFAGLGTLAYAAASRWSDIIAAEDIKRTDGLRAVAVPAIPTVLGIQIGSRGTRAIQVPRFPRSSSGVCRTNHHPVVGAGRQIQSRDVGNGHQAAAVPEGYAAG